MKITELLEEPRSLATLAAAIRVCDHPEEGRHKVALAEPGQMLSLCRVCGAAAAHGSKEDPRFWAGTTIADFVTPTTVAEYEDLYFRLAELAASLKAIQGMTGLRQSSTIELLRKAVDELAQSAVVKAAERLLGVKLNG